MSAALATPLPHPLTRGVEDIGGALDRMPIDAWENLEPATIAALSERLMRIEARVRAQLVAAARSLDHSDYAKRKGATSTGAMLAGAFGGDRRSAESAVRMGETLRAAGRTEDALARGDIGAAQAAIIAGAISDLPDDTLDEHKHRCEDRLIGDASRLSLKDLRSRSLRITDQFKPKPEVDAHENESLESREKSAWKRSEFWMVDNRDGTHRGSFVLPDAQADMLRTAIEAISAPRRDHLHDATPAAASYYDRDLIARTRQGLGFAELCGHLPADQLPGRGGVGATLMVALDYETLVNGVRAATLSTGTRISAGQARQMACNLGLIPQVFGGASLPLDHGAEKRAFTVVQRRAMERRDGGCSFPGCDRPPGWCEAHHARTPFAVGQTTILAEGVLICAHHHRTVHQDGWAIRFSDRDGHPEYRAPRSTIWRRNHRWRP
ncbi:hypothetical protein C6I20_04920 [Aeromicrobium sp. A1-2]|uniref:HNH endonuclease signature motif containing protein n=1 Tax=Aeromicrobium sp. A1-2 TaxID=2107713 RepID=UPI000E5001E2|nr:HNH endonuclease signature motif containing protein [Aeromicrobium sp. A1-2]AXT84600.1 hypothetical protein C6I20_04920 [Aeromicrobium sp. A1-2]